MENEILQQILNKLDSLETKVDTGFANVDKRFDQLSEDVSSILSNELVQTISDQLYYIKTEISIMKSSMGEHEMDLKYLKKVK